MKPLVRRTSNLRDLTVPPKMLKLADKVVLKALFSLPLCTAKENTLANNGDQVSHLNRGESTVKPVLSKRPRDNPKSLA